MRPGSDMIEAFEVPIGFGIARSELTLRHVAGKIIWFGRGQPDRPHRSEYDTPPTSDERELGDFTDDVIGWTYGLGEALADRAIWSHKALVSGGVTSRDMASRRLESRDGVPVRLAPEILRILAPEASVPGGPISDYPKVCRALVRRHGLLEPFIENVFLHWGRNGKAGFNAPAA